MDEIEASRAIEKTVEAIRGLREYYSKEHDSNKRKEIKGRIEKLIQELTDIIKN